MKHTINTILQKRIEEKSEELAQKYFPNEMNIWARPNFEAQYVESACKEIATFALQNQWISVEEALPDKGHDVLVAILNTKTNTYFFGFDAIVDDSLFLRDKNGFTIDVNYHEITHWMSIPSLEGGEK